MSIDTLPPLARAGYPQDRRDRSALFASFANTWLPRLVLSPTIAMSLIFVYGFIGLTAWLSLTNSHMMPNYTLSGLNQYATLFALDRWWVSAANLGIFGGLFIVACLCIGL